ncbi:MAG: HAMP domain-containing protein [Deltaproteobacteria bacterium]|nr:HAMP domain-containing protein [Deltaproteobacteria bacterium]
MAQPILHSFYQDMLKERVEMPRYLMEGMKNMKNTERVQIIRSNGIEEAFQDFKTLKAVEKEYGDLKPGWTADHPNKENNVAQGVDDPRFKEALELLKKGRKEEVYYIEETDGKPIFTYLAPIEFRPKCNACHSSEEEARGILMISTSLEDMYIVLASSRTRWIMYGLFTILGVAILLTVLVKSVITRPIEATVNMLKGIAEGSGDLTQRLAVASNDEVGMLGMWFNKFVEGMQSIVKGIFAASSQVSSASQAIKHSSESIHNSAETQLKAVDETSSSIEEIDASIKSIATDAEELLKATDGASASSLEMSASVDEVAESADKLATSVDVTASAISEIAASLKQVASHVNTLLAETEQVVSATTQVNSAIKEIGALSKEEANLAERVVEIVISRLDAANKSGAAIEKIIQDVVKTSSVMYNLGERSKEISSIVGVINEIADTTNLLAFNAAILAAQAGEHGKGFAVVAEEIKDLARRTASSTQEITELILHVQEDVASAVNSAEQSSSRLIEETVAFSKGEKAALTSITDSSKASLDMARKIERATEAQTKGVGLAAEVINKINVMVEEIKKATDEQSRASEEISHATEDMRDITRKVKQSTAEQVKESKLIAQVIADVAQKMQAIATAMGEQKIASARIVNAIATIRKKTEENLSLTARLDKTVDNLTSQAGSLNEKVGSFKM